MINTTAARLTKTYCLQQGGDWEIWLRRSLTMPPQTTFFVLFVTCGSRRILPGVICNAATSLRAMASALQEVDCSSQLTAPWAMFLVFRLQMQCRRLQGLIHGVGRLRVETTAVNELDQLWRFYYE